MPSADSPTPRDPSPDGPAPTPEDRLAELDAAAAELVERAQAGDAAAALPDIPTEAEIEARIRAATGGKDLEAFRRRVETAKGGGREPGSNPGADYRGAAVGLHVAYVLIGLPMAGAAIGWLVDRQLGTEGAVGYGTLILAVVALAYVIRFLNRDGQR